MRILQIRLKNLNSLAGEWVVDFTNQSFLSDGLFAITGPTGAGKSTLLDAICLALYGRTPRLKVVSKSTNEIMARHTGECFAEIAFETNSGRFRSHWSQKRARSQASGELQTPKHELSDVDSGAVVTTKIKEVAEKIEQATGMNFDRFTRSMMLAQGEFAAFLKAAPDEKSPILEQITGSEIYSRISIRVHESRSQARRDLDLLSAELKGLNLSTEEEETAENCRLAVLLESAKEIRTKVVNCNEQLLWYQEFEKCSQKRDALKVQASSVNEQIEQFASKKVELLRAKTALQLDGLYSTLTSKRSSLNAETMRLSSCEKEMPERLNEVKEKTSIVELALANLNSIKMKVSEIQNRVNEARALDAALNEKDLHRNNLQASLLEKQRASDAAKISISDIAAKESSCNQSLSVVVGEINSIVNGDALVEVLSALRILIQGWQEQAIAVDQIEEKVQQIKAIIAIEEGAKATLKTELEVLLSRLAAIEQDVQKAMSEMQQLSQGKTLVQLASELSSLSSKASSLKELAAYFESSDNLTILLTELAEKTVKAEQKKIELVQAKQHAISKLGSAEEKESLLDKQLDLERRIQSLEIQRKALKGGEPCPLCGALEHPFTAGHNESTNETEAALKKHKTDLKLMRAELNSIDVSFGQTETELLGLEKSQLSASVELKKVSGKIEISQAQFDEFKGDISMAAIRVQLAKVENGQKILAKVINDVEALEQRVAAGNVSRNSISDQKILIEQRLAATIQNAEAELRSLESCQQDLAGAKEQLRLSKSHIDDRLSPFQVFPDGSDNYPGILEKLTRLSDKRLQKLIEKERLESEIVRFAADKGKQSAMLTELLAMVTEFDRQLQLAESERQISWALRVSLIGERPLKEIESENDKNLNEVIQVHDSAAKSLQLAVQTLGLLENQNKELKERVFTLDAEIQREESDFSIQVAALGFAGESEFLAAKLPLDALQALELEDKLLERENDQLKRLSVELEEALTLLQAKKNFTETVDAISSMVDGLKQSENEVSEQIGAIKSRLHENQKLREEFEGKAEILRRQQKDFDKWDELHSLIGSADGKKFRNFAQGLTFDLVLANANRHLQKMSDRYLLVRDNSSPLDLNVIDNYQSSEVRSAKNLSGGESFIVSLALALGLSQMASHNVRVDSLFLDEGFGSLDEDALELAIEALASLQQQGKMIGLISHIESVKERISTQISVVPQANGRSCLVGPGCSAK